MYLKHHTRQQQGSQSRNRKITCIWCWKGSFYKSTYYSKRFLFLHTSIQQLAIYWPTCSLYFKKTNQDYEIFIHLKYLLKAPNPTLSISSKFLLWKDPNRALSSSSKFLLWNDPNLALSISSKFLFCFALLAKALNLALSSSSKFLFPKV